ncbi:hypothetical protein SSS_05519 [Sarcoptes scabiei]|uniref:Uncharacterized protein n=1 Tax=Sarcoptes scabiei TaxID=52283 RepID=A0A834VGW5_SARSC|nr:hypothetical protein SSS_05519 [Sarcoptes scabiei]
MSYNSLSDTSSLPIQFGLHPISSKKISSPLRQSSASVSASTSTSTSTSIASTTTSTSTLSSNLSNNNETNSLKRSKNFLKFSQSNQSRIRKQSIEKETNTNESISTSSIMDHSIFGSKSISNQNRSQTIDTNRFDNDGLILPKKLINPSCIESKVKKEVHREMLWKMKNSNSIQNAQEFHRIYQNYQRKLVEKKKTEEKEEFRKILEEQRQRLHNVSIVSVLDQKPQQRTQSIRNKSFGKSN